jgi:NAD(P)-dependent dehydrogenase (short-subunit alcohol dehydrogenase family)
MSNNLQGKVIAVTSAGSGIGLATAHILASRGAILSLADNQETLLNETVSSIASTGAIVTGTVVDVSSRSSVETWISSTVSEYGKLNGAANIAGVRGNQLGSATIENIEDEDLDFVWGVNAKGMLNCLRAEIRNTKDGASIVNVASVAGIMGLPMSGAYVASKHTVVGLTRVAAIEKGPRGVKGCEG